MSANRTAPFRHTPSVLKFLKRSPRRFYRQRRLRKLSRHSLGDESRLSDGIGDIPTALIRPETSRFPASRGFAVGRAVSIRQAIFRRDDPLMRFRCVGSSSHDRFIEVRSSSRQCDHARDRYARARSSSLDKASSSRMKFFYMQRLRALRWIVIRCVARREFFASHR
jgi:hypothetical protein